MGAYQSYLDWRAARLEKARKEAEEQARKEAEEYQKRYDEALLRLKVDPKIIQQAHQQSSGIGPPPPHLSR